MKMSMTQWLKLVLVIASICSSSATAMAQFGGGQAINSPRISPYVNMLRSDSSPALNYYGLVRPQQEFAQQNQQLNQGLQGLQMQQGMNMQMTRGGYSYSQLGATGHPVLFNSFGTSRFSGGYVGSGGGGFGGGGIGGGGFNGGGFGAGGLGAGGFGTGGFGAGNVGQSGFGGVGTPGGGFGGVSAGYGGSTGQLPQFGGIGNTYRPGR